MPEKVEDMKEMKLKMVPYSEVRILLSVEDPDEQQREAAQSVNTTNVSSS